MQPKRADGSQFAPRLEKPFNSTPVREVDALEQDVLRSEDVNAQGLDGFGEPNSTSEVPRESAPGVVGHLPEVRETEGCKVAKVASCCASLRRFGDLPLAGWKISALAFGRR